MKKILMSAVTLSLLLAGCANNETFNENTADRTISFSAYAGISRAVVTSTNGGNGTNQLTEFKILGIQNDQTTPVIENLNNEKYVLSSGTWGAEDGSVATWPVDPNKFPTKFYAYAPLAGTGNNASNFADISYGAGGVVERTYTIPDYDSQLDYLAAYTGDVNNNIATSNQAVSINFKHILSQIQFKIEVAKGYTIMISRVKLKNISSSGKYNFNRTNDITNAAVANIDDIWTNHGGSFEYRYGLSSVATIDASSTAANVIESLENGKGNNIMLVPQKTVSATDAALTTAGKNFDESEPLLIINYILYKSGDHNLVGKFYEQGITPLSELPAAQKLYASAAFRLKLDLLADGSNRGWLPNKKYIYTLKFGTGGNGGFNTTDEFVDENGDPTGETVTDPDGTPIPPQAPFIKSQNIGFTVTVADWTDFTNGVVIEGGGGQ